MHMVHVSRIETTPGHNSRDFSVDNVAAAPAEAANILQCLAVSLHHGVNTKCNAEQ